jgi:hypothetical protein
MGMELGKLVERHEVGGVLVAEDVSAASAMVSTLEEVEVFVASRVVALDSLAIFLRRHSS